MARLATLTIRDGYRRDAFIKVGEELMAFESLGDSLAFMEKRCDFYDVLIGASKNGELRRICR